MTTLQYDGIKLLSTGINPSPTVTSLSSGKSSINDSDVKVFGAMHFSIVCSQHITFSSSLSNTTRGVDGFG